MDIEGANAIDNFELIEKVDDNNTYLALIVIDWEFDMNVVINLKKCNMVIVPLDPAEGV